MHTAFCQIAGRADAGMTPMRHVRDGHHTYRAMSAARFGNDRCNRARIEEWTATCATNSVTDLISPSQSGVAGNGPATESERMGPSITHLIVAAAESVTPCPKASRLAAAARIKF